MSSGFIIIERDIEMKDRGVFTGQIQIVDTRLAFYDEEHTKPVQLSDGVASPDLDHAFTFYATSTAWRYAMQFEPHWDEQRRRYWAFRRWVVRKDGDFYPGECIHRKEPIGVYTGSGIAREVLLRERHAGFEQGRESILLERAYTVPS